MAKIIHAADLHLDYKNKQIQKIDADGRNIREADFFNAFRELVDIVIAKQPDAFVIAGDLYDTPRPSQIVIKGTIAELNRLEAAGVETVIQAGNHDTPQLRTTTSAFEALMEIDYKHIHFVYDGIQRVGIGDMEFIVVPHLSVADGFDPELLRPDFKSKKYSVLVLHGVADGSDIFKQVDEAREMPLGAHILNMGHTYIALGHYHKRSEVRKNAWYSGSLENGSFGPDVQNEKGGLLVDLEKVGTKGYAPELLKVKIRKIVDFGVYDAAGKTVEELEQDLAAMITGKSIKNTLARIRVKNISKGIYSGVDKAKIRGYGAEALYFKDEWQISQIESTVDAEGNKVAVSNEKIQDLETEWKTAVEQRYAKPDESMPRRELVVDRGVEYLRSFQEEIDASED